MNEHFLNYEQSLAVKELGFDEPCFMSYNPNANFWDMYCTNSQLSSLNGNNSIVCAAPLKSQFFKWVREKYGIDSDINVNVSQHDFSKGYDWYIFAHTKSKVGHLELWSDPQNMPIGEYTYETYEQAEDGCIDKIIELLKNKTT